MFILNGHWNMFGTVTPLVFDPLPKTGLGYAKTSHGRARDRRGIFFPRVRTPCGHGAQVIVEGREEQTDGGERNEDPKTNPNQTPKPAGRNSTIL